MQPLGVSPRGCFVLYKGDKMRKAHKKLLLEIFDSLHEAHSEIKKLMNHGSSEEARALMAQCQDAAVDIGTTIDDLEGDGTAAVKYLEEYCEALYQVHEGIIADMTRNKAFTLLEEKLKRAENSLKNEIKEKLEIVFMPYKSSMWDSLESIWRAADADPDCDAYVVPIPYYDRNPDHSFGDFHYEGREFPADVPVVHYENYDLEERRPDIIYIHNPYDGDNFVTSIDPRFYSGELKKYTDMLVYVPYFVWKPYDPHDPEEVKKRVSYCAPPSVRNVDRYVTLTDYMCDLHIKTYISRFGGDLLTRHEAEKKFIIAGSPKIDKMLSLTAENTGVPEEWLKKAENKKVVFYNTGLVGILNSTPNYLSKLQSVLNFFKERTDCVLLWRPHPLMESTLHSMMPELMNGYMNIKNRFIADGSGIFDDTPDTLRAMYLSDMIYGDISSVCTQFEQLGLPVLYQKVGENDRAALEEWISSSPKKNMKSPGADYVSNGAKIHQMIKSQVLGG